MNTLTKNRILQEGDEYLTGTDWKPVPNKHFGLQIEFTKYTEVRRPSEKPISPIQAADKIATPVTAEGDNAKLCKQPALRKVETPSPVAHAPKEPEKQDPSTGVRDLPTVISKKAHVKAEHCPALPKEIPVTALIEYPAGATDETLWTGRNGTFRAKAIVMTNSHDIIEVNPVGERGIGNCTIQFPASIIPQMVDWLLRQQTTPKT